MGKFIERVKEFATGKNAEEREYAEKIEREIRSESMKAELEERRIQNVRLARERIKAKAEAKLRSFRQPQQSGGGFNMFTGYGNPFGQPRTLGTRTVRTVRVPTRKVKKSKVKYVYRKAPSIVPRRFDVIGGFDAKPRKGFRVI